MPMIVMNSPIPVTMCPIASHHPAQRIQMTLPTNDAVKIKAAFQQLEGSAYRIADAIYADQAKSGT